MDWSTCGSEEDDAGASLGPSGAGARMVFGPSPSRSRTVRPMRGTRTSSDVRMVRCWLDGMSGSAVARRRCSWRTVGTVDSARRRICPLGLDVLASARISPLVPTEPTTSPGSTSGRVRRDTSTSVPVVPGHGRRRSMNRVAGMVGSTSTRTSRSIPRGGAWSSGDGIRAGSRTGLQRGRGCRVVPPPQGCGPALGQAGSSQPHRGSPGAFHVVWNQGVRGENHVYYARLEL